MAGAGGIAVPLIDAHCHFWTLARGDYGWLDGALVRHYNVLYYGPLGNCVVLLRDVEKRKEGT